MQNVCCKRAFLKGSFLAAGSISDPQKGYHFDIVCDSEEIAVMMYGPDSTQQLVYCKLLKFEALGYVDKFYSNRSYKFIITSDGSTVRYSDDNVISNSE